LKKEYSVSEILQVSLNGLLPKKIFLINNMVKKFSNRLHWFTSQRVFNDTNPYKDTIAFRCKICKKTIEIRFPTLANLSHHLKLDEHSAFKRWLASQPDHVKGGRISDALLSLVKYLVSSYSSIAQTKNKHLLDILRPEIRKEIPCYKVFRYTSLPAILKLLYAELNKRLNMACTITLVLDIWTNSVMADFLGLAAILTYDIGHKDLLIIGLGRMKGNHDADSIRTTVQGLINAYDFDTSKITCNDIYLQKNNDFILYLIIFFLLKP